MKCKSCGAEIDNGAIQCTHCQSETGLSDGSGDWRGVSEGNISATIGAKGNESKLKRSLVPETEKLERFISSALSGVETLFARVVFNNPAKIARGAKILQFYRMVIKYGFKIIYRFLNLNAYVRIGAVGLVLLIIVVSVAIGGKAGQELSQAEQALREQGIDHPAITRYCLIEGNAGNDTLIVENEPRNGLTDERMVQFPETYYRIRFSGASRTSIEELDYSTGSDTSLDWKYTELGEQRSEENTKMILGK